MRTLVLGAGAIGGYFGGRLAEAGADVTFLVRPERQRKLAANGLVVKSQLGDIERQVATVLADAVKQPFDVVLLTCKAYDLDAAMTAIAPAMGPKSVVLPLLNGLLHIDTLSERFGRERVLGGACYIGGMLMPDGRIQHTNQAHSLIFGELAGGSSARTDAIAAEFGKAKFKPVRSERVMGDMWQKFVVLASLAAMTTLMHANVGEIVAAGEGEGLANAVLGEAEAVASAAGYPMSAEADAGARGMLTQRGSNFVASMRGDMERGGATEGDHVIGDMVRRGAKLGVATPILRVALCNLQIHEMKRKK